MAQTKGIRKDRFTWGGGQVVWDEKPAKKKTVKTVKPAKKGKK